MTTPPTVESAHYIRVRYHGPTGKQGPRLVATWEGWMSPHGGRSPRVRRTIPAEIEREKWAPVIAGLFCDWLGQWDGTTATHKFEPDRITVASDLDGGWAVLVLTKVAD